MKIGRSYASRYGAYLPKVIREEYIRDVETVTAYTAMVETQDLPEDQRVVSMAKRIREGAVDRIREVTHTRKSHSSYLPRLQHLQAEGYAQDDILPYLVDETDIEEDACIDQMHDTLHEALCYVPVRQMMLFKMVVMYCIPRRDVGIILGVSPSRITQILQAVSSFLQRWMADRTVRWQGQGRPDKGGRRSSKWPFKSYHRRRRAHG